MKQHMLNHNTVSRSHRRGSTLVIVVALLGLLAFLGTMFYTFAVQERAAANFFSDAAKAANEEPPNVWDHMARQIITGPGNRPNERPSILRSPNRRHSLVNNMIGDDIHPHTGEGIRVEYTGLVPTIAGGGPADWLDFVDSPSARFGSEDRAVPPPAADVDYTYPDINNLFLAYKGFAIRDNGTTPPPGTPRYEQVRVIIPSFFRPQYLRTPGANGPGGVDVPTDLNWASRFDGVNRPTAAPFSARSFRPHPQHIAGFQADGTTPVFRYLTDGEATTLGVASGGFPFIPADEAAGPGNNGVRGELGIWTGSDPSVYELDSDNDGDGIREGIWLDLHYPVQETSTGQLYVILHSVTIYDLDALIDLNVHGNLAGLERLGHFFKTGVGLVREGTMETQLISRSNLGLGPNEISPLWAMRRGVPIAGHPSLEQFTAHFGRTPTNNLEQANMEWLWMLAGRGRFSSGGTVLDDLFAGRWGETDRTFNAVRPGAGTFLFQDLPRPGRSDNAQQSGTSGIRFGGGFGATTGRNGFDDNQDRFEGEADPSQGRIRPFGHPMDYAGTGRSSLGQYGAYTGTIFTVPVGSDPRLPLLHHDPVSTGPERWLGYVGYGINRAMSTLNPRYIFGQNSTLDNATGDDLIANPFFDAMFEDPLETIFDVDFATRMYDEIFGPQDLVAAHLAPGDLASSPDSITTRLADLAPFALENATNNNVRERFTTLTNSLRRFMVRHDLGPDLRLGTADDGPRAWEFSADSDGADRNNDGFGDGDGILEFPPQFGGAIPYRGYFDDGINPPTPGDPFRPQVRRLLMTEAGENRQLLGQLPLSINHILDVERNAQTPDEVANPALFLQYMQRAGMRFRNLVEHPDANEGAAVLNASALPTWPVLFPPTTPEQREFWARRDRQKLARDVYVLLYTMGGGALPSGAGVVDYTTVNNPNGVEGTVGTRYTHAQLRRMAQFAVNMVDAMDTDNVVTKFEYDKNLGDGWNLDDNAYDPDFVPLPESDPNFAAASANGFHREDSVERGVVYGVEAQQFAFSEVLGIRSAEITAGNHAATLHLDQNGVRDHLFVELQNMQPMINELATTASTTAETSIWRIVRHDRVDPAHPIGGTGTGGRGFRTLALQTDGATTHPVNGGQNFTVAVASRSDVVSSDFYVDYDLNGTFEQIAPDVGTAPLPTLATNPTDAAAPELKPRCRLDLLHPDHLNQFQVLNDAGTVSAVLGDFLTSVQAHAGNTPMTNIGGGTFLPGPLGFDLVLQRRANPNMPSLPPGVTAADDPNPWVDVDYVQVLFQNFDIADGDNAAALQGKLDDELESSERAEPLNDVTRTLFTGGIQPDFRQNTIGNVTNSNATAGGFQLWQAHFDRDFASAGELLNLPLYAPVLLTQVLDKGRYPAYQQALGVPTPGAPDLNRLVTAEAMFLQPDFPDLVGPGDPGDLARDNRWYRLMQFVEVPSRVHRMLGNYLALERVPGKINLNTLRHWEVYAGLVDNPIFLDEEPNPIATGRFTADRTPGLEVRDRLSELLQSRDGAAVVGYDPAAATGRNFIIPGTPNSRPFRSPGRHGTTTATDNGIEDTILRRLPADQLDVDLDTNRHWLEVGDRDQHRIPGRASTVHRHQVLSKIMNNSTTVSNTFIMYATAAYFEAVPDPTSGLIRVGGRLDLAPNAAPPVNPGWQQRAVFVIDRTEAFKAYDAGTGDFDWRRLVKYRATIE